MSLDAVLRGSFLRSKSSLRRGRLNDVDRCITHKIIHLNSKFRENYYTTKASDFLYKFPMPIKNALSLRVRSIDIPNSWYNFSKYIGNTHFKIKVHERFLKDKSHRLNPRPEVNKVMEEPIPMRIFKIEIPEGNWSPYELSAYLNNNYFYQQKTSKKNDLCYLKFSITETALNARFDVLKETPNDFVYDIYFADDDYTIPLIFSAGWTLGFRMAEYKNLSGSLDSEALYNADGHRLLFIGVEDFNVFRNENDFILTTDAFIDKGILGKIYMNDGKFNVTVCDDDGDANLKKRFYNGPVNISKVHIKLLDENGNVIDLNNMDFSLALEFDIQSQKWDY